jgi:predicted O-linked N-acetylglucosamine transferase (SPINDLY family)
MANKIPLEPFLEQAIRLHQAGDAAGSEALCRQILSQDPKHPGTLNQLGMLALQAGRWDKALALFAKLSTREPQWAQVHHGHGMALMGLGRHRDACGPLRRALRIQPDLLQARVHLGTALANAKCFVESETIFRECVARNPADKQSWLDLSTTLQSRKLYEEALQVINDGLQAIQPFPEADFVASLILYELQRWQESIEAIRRVLAQSPHCLEALINLATVLARVGELDEALACYDRAIQVNPGAAGLHNNRAKSLMELGRIPEAIAGLRQTLVLEPTSPVASSNLLLVLHYLPEVEAADVFAEHVEWNRKLTSGIAGAPRLFPNPRTPDRRLRIGYVSADFREHSVARMIALLFENHDPDQCELFGYSLVNQRDAWTERLSRCTAGWRDVATLSDEKFAECVRQDRIDILVDLGGHTGDNRLLVFAHRPAPVQVTFLGYPDTTGMDAIGYRLTDSLADPPGSSDALATESLVRIDPCAWSYPELPYLEVSPRFDGPITFGCFNTLAKLNEPLFGLWARVLAQVDNSRLLLKASGWASRQARQNALGFFQQAGIAPERIEFLGRVESYEEHLGLHRRIDIALDPFPYHGTNMTCEALWMGVPVITMAGDRHVSRVGISLLTTVGHPELIASCPDEYVRLAVDLAGDAARLARLRAGLRADMLASPLMDGIGYARRVEAAYRTMWQHWCAG